MSEQTNPQPSAPAPAGNDPTSTSPTSTSPAAPAGALAVGDRVISWYDDDPVVYGGDDERGFPTLTFGVFDGRTPVRKCHPARVAPADAPVPARDERVKVVKRTRAEMPYGEPGVWQLSLDVVYAGVLHPSWHRTKRDATATGLRRLAILDWHAAHPDAAPRA